MTWNRARAAAKRVLRSVLALVALVFALFLMAHGLGGDPVRAALGPTAPPEIVAARRKALHLDDPLPEQFVRYLAQLSHMDFGTSIASGEPVDALLRPRILNSALLALAALLVMAPAAPLGAAVSTLTARGRRRWVTSAYDLVSSALTSIPEFLLAAGLIFLFAVVLRVAPVAGKDGAASYLLPALALGLGPAAVLVRIAKVETDRVLLQPYLTMAMSKHLPMSYVYIRHILPNTIAPVLAVLGTSLTSLLGGAVLVENVFAWPGLGTELVAAITVRDYSIIQAVGLFLGVGALLINTGVDLLIALIDDHPGGRGR